MSIALAAERAAALAAVDAIIASEPEADRILRGAVAAVAAELDGARWVAVAFVEPDGLVTGPLSGARGADEEPTQREPVRYDDRAVAELWVAAGGEADAEDIAFLRRLADLLAPYCLVGWDTGGDEWEYGLGLDVDDEPAPPAP